MEFLIIGLVEAVVAIIELMVLALPLVAEVLVAIGCLIVDLVLRLFNKQRLKKAPAVASAPSVQSSPEPAADPLPPAKVRRSFRMPRWLLIGSSALAALFLIGILVVNQWFLDDIARHLLSRQQERTGMLVTAETIEGNLFTGRFHASGIVVKRENHPDGLIDLTVRRAEVVVPLFKLLSDVIPVTKVHVEGVQGRFERGVPGQSPAEKEKFTLKLARAFQPKHHFEIHDLTISDVQLAYADHTRPRPLAVPVTLEKLTAQPLRSRFAIFDLFFRSNANGTIAGQPFRIATSGDDLGRTTEWTANGLPVALLAGQIGGPFALLNDGTCDVRVVDRWRNSDEGRVITMDWSIVLNRVTAEVPATISPKLALLSKAVVLYINTKGERVPLAFTMEIDENNFDGTATAAAAGLWDTAADALALTLGKELGIETDAVKDAGKGALDISKGLLEKWRKKKQTE